MSTENESIPQPWNEESHAGILRLIEERDRARELATKKTAEAEDNLVRAVLAERENAKLRAVFFAKVAKLPPPLIMLR